MRFERGDTVNNGFATFRVLRYLSEGRVSLVRKDRGNTVCTGTTELDECDLYAGELKTINPNHIAVSVYTDGGIYVGNGDVVFE